MAVRIRMKKMGRRHRPFYRICAMDARRPRGGRVLEELGTYDPLVPDVDARALLKGERIQYWLSVGAQPTEKVKVLIKKYGAEGTHAAQQEAALDRLVQQRRRPEPIVQRRQPARPAPDEEAPAADAASEVGEEESLDTEADSS